jgi:hypothetical protein
MAQTTYSFTISTAFPNHKVNTAVLTEAIQEYITTHLDFVNANIVPDQCDVTFADALSAPEQAVLDMIVSSHQGYGYTAEIKGTIPISAGDVEITADQSWQVLCGVTTSPNFFSSNLNEIMGRIVGQVIGDGGQIRIMEEVEGQPDRELTVPERNLPNTASQWLPFKVDTNRPPSDTIRNVYRVEARRNGATNLRFRYASISMMVVKIYW